MPQLSSWAEPQGLREQLELCERWGQWEALGLWVVGGRSWSSLFPEWNSGCTAVRVEAGETDTYDVHVHVKLIALFYGLVDFEIGG